jgi:hypothetical protein
MLFLTVSTVGQTIFSSGMRVWVLVSDDEDEEDEEEEEEDESLALELALLKKAVMFVDPDLAERECDWTGKEAEVPND